MQSLLIGCDPELFVFNNGSQEFISAHDIFPGTKYDPHPVGTIGAVQVDGTAFEFNIRPSSTSAEFIRNINGVLHFARIHLKNVAPDLEFKTEPTALFNQTYFDNLPAFPKLLGCEPDFNAWTGKVNPKPKTKLPMRTGSGHVHLGWTEMANPTDPAHLFDVHSVVKQLDVGLFIPSLLWDADNMRRTLYGKPGAFRPKPYGCEYRVLSNKWVGDRDLMQYVFDATKHSHDLLEKDIKLYEDKEFKEAVATLANGDDISRHAINSLVNRLEDDFDFPTVPAL